MPQSLDAPLAKQFKTHGEQIALLRERGMLIESDSEACRLLERVNYYRLSGYWYSWRKLLEPGKRADSFIEGTTLDDVAAVYMFDCKLREIVFACLAPIELSVRSMLGHELGRSDTFAHLHPNVLGPLSQASDGEGSSAGYLKWLARYEKELRASREDFVAHHNKKYGGKLPIWAAVEVMDWGSLTYLYQLAPIGVRDTIAARVDLTAAQFGGLVGLGACGLVVAGMAWLGARVYDPDTFSFLSPDPLADPPAGVLWASNPYGYAANNPLVFSDPAGYKPVTDAQLLVYNQNRTRSGMAVAGDFVADNWEYVAAAAAIAGGVALMATGVGGPAGIALMAASGALLSGGVSIGVQKYSTGNVDWTKVGQDSAVGAVTGLIGGSGFAAGKAAYVANSAAGNTSKALLTSFSINAASGAASSEAAYLLNSRIYGTPITASGMLGAAAGGSVANGLGGFAGPAGNTLAKDLGGVSSRVYSTGLSTGSDFLGSAVDDYISEGQVDIRRAATTSLIGTAIDNTGQYFARNAGLANKIELRGLNSMSQYGIAHPRTLKGITNFSAPNTQRLWYGTAYDSLIGFGADIATGVIDNVLSK